MRKEKIIEMEKEYMMHTYARLPLILKKGKGMYVWDTDGKKYLDMVAGIAVLSLGHSHQEIVSAISEQVSAIVHTSNLYYTEPQVVLAKILSDISLGGKVFFANSGAEANEAAFKIARKYARKMLGSEEARRKEKPSYVVISAMNSFHGRTLATLAATGQPEKQKMFEPMPAGFKTVAFNDAGALESAIDKETCAVILEAIQGEGGVIPADKEYLRNVRALCDRNDLLFILDEVQTGVARTGSYFAFESYGIKPDMITLAKGLGGGFPIGAVVASKKVSDILVPGDHGTTFGGSPIVCRAALAVLRTIEKEDLLENARIQGSYLMDRLFELEQRHTIIKKIRGLGLMIGIVLGEDVAGELLKTCMGQGAIINKTSENVIRLLPPLIIGKDHVDEFVDIFDRSLTMIQRNKGKV